ncbi:hypothetical protein EGY05_15350 [Chryseobacterium arthrosphaerae]|nr:hypothetical protein EGY05_15350 [Chryseobacterium arthrosphaerae]
MCPWFDSWRNHLKASDFSEVFLFLTISFSFLTDVISSDAKIFYSLCYIFKGAKSAALSLKKLF